VHRAPFIKETRHGIDPRRRPHHPSHRQLQEHITATPERDDTFTITTTFEKPIDALGIWLMADGDDTRSKFKVTVTGIELTTP